MITLSQTDKKVASKHYSTVDFVEVIDQTGDFTKIEGINVLVKSLRNMLMTPLGTYIFDPEYGSELYKKIFELADDQTKEEIIFEVRDRIKLYDPKVNIKNVDVNYYSDSKGFYVTAILEKGGYDGELVLSFNEYNLSFSMEESQ